MRRSKFEEHRPIHSFFSLSRAGGLLGADRTGFVIRVFWVRRHSSLNLLYRIRKIGKYVTSESIVFLTGPAISDSANLQDKSNV